MPTNFMGMMGFKNLAINVTGQAAWGMTRLRVALALDNTGSMADDGKITALKIGDQEPARPIEERRRQ